MPISTGSLNPYRADSFPAGAYVRIRLLSEDDSTFNCVEVDENGCWGVLSKEGDVLKSYLIPDILATPKFHSIFGRTGCDLECIWGDQDSEIYLCRQYAELLFPIDSAFILRSGRDSSSRLTEFPVISPIPIRSNVLNKDNRIVGTIPVGAWVKIEDSYSGDSHTYSTCYSVYVYASESWLSGFRKSRNLSGEGDKDRVYVYLGANDLTSQFGRIPKEIQLHLQQLYVDSCLSVFRDKFTLPSAFWDSLEAEAALKNWGPLRH